VAVYTVSDASGVLNSGMDIIPSTGVLVGSLDMSWVPDGTASVSVSLTNGNGNSAAVNATVTKDTVAPVLAVTGVPSYINSANVGSFRPQVTGEKWSALSFTMTDGAHPQAGSSSTNGSTWWNPAITASAFNDGPLTLTVTEYDGEGNRSVLTVAVVKDTVAPAGSFTIAGTAINGATATTNPVLALSLGFADLTSGLYQVAVSTNGGSSYGATQGYSSTASATLGTDGLYTVAIKVFDAAGNSAVFTRSVRLDRAGPAITTTITAPANLGSYDLGQKITLTYSGTDVDGVVSTTATLDGAPVASGAATSAETLSAGAHTVVITSRDGLGNVSTTTFTIQVHATVAGLSTAVSDGVSSTKITSNAVSSQLSSYLSSAQAALNARNHASAISSLTSFVNLVQAQSGVSIDAAYATLLAGWANDLISGL
jgi:large repetitive protein